MDFQPILDDQNPFDQDPFAGLHERLQKMVAWKRVATAILVVLGIFLWLGFLMIIFTLMEFSDSIGMVLAGIYGVLTITTTWVVVRFFRSASSVQRYLNSHNERDLEDTLQKQIATWRSFGITLLIWTVLGIGTPTLLIFQESSASPEEPVMTEPMPPVELSEPPMVDSTVIIDQEAVPESESID